MKRCGSTSILTACLLVIGCVPATPAGTPTDTAESSLSCEEPLSGGLDFAPGGCMMSDSVDAGCALWDSQWATCPSWEEALVWSWEVFTCERDGAETLQWVTIQQPAGEPQTAIELYFDTNNTVIAFERWSHTSDRWCCAGTPTDTLWYGEAPVLCDSRAPLP